MVFKFGFAFGFCFRSAAVFGFGAILAANALGFLEVVPGLVLRRVENGRGATNVSTLRSFWTWIRAPVGAFAQQTHREPPKAAMKRVLL